MKIRGSLAISEIERQVFSGVREVNTSIYVVPHPPTFAKRKMVIGQMKSTFAKARTSLYPVRNQAGEVVFGAAIKRPLRMIARRGYGSSL